MFDRTVVMTCVVVALAGCSAPPTAGAKTPKATAAASPGTGAKPALNPTAAATSGGRVIGLDGKAAAGVKIVAYLISNDGASVVAQGGGNLISNDGGSYGLLATPTTIETTTDADGAFALTLPAGQHANVEANLKDDLKAIKLDAASADGIVLQLDYPGTVQGKVVAPAGSTVTNFTGVDVFIPGTSYAAKANAEGAFTFSGLPAGKLPIVASKTGLGTVTSTVTVVAHQTITMPDLALALTAPTIASIAPSIGAPGAKLTIKGTNFGASTGDPFTVTLAGATLASPKRVDDQTIEVTLPDNATTGDVVVSVAGTPGPAAKLIVAKAIAIPTAIHDLWVGTSLPLTAIVLDVGNKPYKDVVLDWKAAGTAVTVDAKGVLVAKEEGTAKVTASNGGVSKTFDVSVHAAPFVATLAGANLLAPVPGLSGLGDGVGDQVGLGAPYGVVAGPAGIIYFSESQSGLIRKLSPTGQVTSLAGSFDPSKLTPQQLLTGGGGLADGQGEAARFAGPRGMALDADGNLIVADAINCRIRKVTPDGTVTTLAGGGPAADFTGAGGGYKDGAALEAQFSSPSDVAIAANGDIYIADTGNHMIRKLTPAGQVSTAAGVSTVVGISRVGGYLDGEAAAAKFDSPRGLAIDQAGNLYVADSNNHRIRMLSATGHVTTLAGGGKEIGNQVPPEPFKDGKGDAARFYFPNDVALDADGSLIVADGDNTAIRVVAQDGTVTTLVGTGAVGGFPAPGGAVDGLLATAKVGQVSGVAVGPDGTIYFTDGTNGQVRKIVRKGP